MSGTIHIVTGIPFSVTFNNGTNTFTCNTAGDFTSTFAPTYLLTALGGSPNGGYQSVVSSTVTSGHTVVTVASYSTGTAYPGPATFSTGTGTAVWFNATSGFVSPWTRVDGGVLGSDTPSYLAILSTSDAAITTSGFNIVYTTNGGSSWTSVPTPFANQFNPASMVAANSTLMTNAPTQVAMFQFNGTLTTELLTGVVITGTAGQFSCTATTVTLLANQTVTISGTEGGTGSISGYTDPSTYTISETNGSTTFTLTQFGLPITTTAGTPTGLTYTSGTALTVNSTSIGKVQQGINAYTAGNADFVQIGQGWGNTFLVPGTSLTNGTYNLTGKYQGGSNMRSTDGGVTWTDVTPSQISSTPFTGGLGTLVGGTSYTNGVYLSVPFTTSGSGVGATGTVVVSGGTVTEVDMYGNFGFGYQSGDTLSANNSDIGGTGSGFSVTISSAYPAYSEVLSQPYYSNTASAWLMFNACNPTSPPKSVWRSTNNGTSWTNISTPEIFTNASPTADNIGQCFLDLSSNILVAGATNFNDAAVYQSTDGGVTWANVLTQAQVLTTVAITGTAGQFSCDAVTAPLAVNQAMTISGSLTGTGSISGYSDPTGYWIIATNGSTTFTLSDTLGGTAITTTAGTTDGLTFANSAAVNFLSIVKNGSIINVIGTDRPNQLSYNYTSTTGNLGSWTPQATAIFLTTAPPYIHAQVVFDSDFVTGFNTTDGTSIGYSSNGVTWTPVTLTGQGGTGLATDSSRIYDYGLGIYSSTNNTTWTLELDPATIGSINAIQTLSTLDLAIGSDLSSNGGIWKRT